MTTIVSIALVGAVIVTIGWIIYLYLAFTQRILWGLGVLLLPYVELLFTVFHWQRARTAFFVYVIGHVVCLGALFGGAAEQFQDFLYESEEMYDRGYTTKEEILGIIAEFDSFRFGRFEPKPGAMTPLEVRAQQRAEEKARERQKEEEERRRAAELERKKQKELEAIFEIRAQEAAVLRQQQLEKEKSQRKRASKSRDAFIQNAKPTDWYK